MAVLISLVSITSLAEARPSEQAFVAQAEEALAERHPGRAILELERARLLSSGSRVIADDLARARLAADLPATEPSVAGTSAQLLRTDQWGEVALAGLALATGALIAVVGKLARRAFLIIALVGGFVAAAGFWRTVRAEPPPNLAVVTSRGLVARSAQSMQAGAVFIPPEGSFVSIERAEGRFVLIAAGRSRGWVPAGDVETILPGT